MFGAKAATPFLNKNNIITIVRGHEAQLEGFKMSKWNTTGEFPSVITVFSAPNYCGEFDNAGAMMVVDESLMCSFKIIKNNGD